MPTPLLQLLFAAVYEWLTYRLYGHGHFLQATVYPKGPDPEA